MISIFFEIVISLTLVSKELGQNQKVLLKKVFGNVLVFHCILDYEWFFFEELKICSISGSEEQKCRNHKEDL